MKRPANAALATERFDSSKGMPISHPVTAKQGNDEAVIRLYTFKRPEESAAQNRKPFLILKCTTEQFKDALWLVAAIVIISIIHRYVPNSGAPPHSIVEIVRSATVFPQ